MWYETGRSNVKVYPTKRYSPQAKDVLSKMCGLIHCVFCNIYIHINYIHINKVDMTKRFRFSKYYNVNI